MDTGRSILRQSQFKHKLCDEDLSEGGTGGGHETCSAPQLSTGALDLSTGYPHDIHMRILGLDIRRALSPEQEQEEAPLRKRVHRLEMALTELVEKHNTLAGNHLKLRNQFNGAKGGRPAASEKPETLSSIPHGDKAALRRALGVVPGKPFHHQE